MRESQQLAEKLVTMRDRLRGQGEELDARLGRALDECAAKDMTRGASSVQMKSEKGRCDDLRIRKERIATQLQAHATRRPDAIPEVGGALDAGHDRGEIADLLADSEEKVRRKLGVVRSRIAFVKRRKNSMRHSRSAKHRLFNESLPQRLAQVQTDSFSLTGSAASSDQRTAQNEDAAGNVTQSSPTRVGENKVGTTAGANANEGRAEAMADSPLMAPTEAGSAAPTSDTATAGSNESSNFSSGNSVANSSSPSVGFGSVSSVGAASQSTASTSVVVGRGSIDPGAFRLDRQSDFKSMSESDLKKEQKRLEDMLKSIDQKKSKLRN